MLLLLDIDGVMVIGNSWKKPEFLDDGFPAFNNRATIALQKLICETSASILLTTSHKSKYSVEQWQKIFNLRGLNNLNISVLPENKTHLNRKEEILNWVDSLNEIPHFLIIDDDKTLNGLPSYIKNKLIQTNSSLGLTNVLVEEALEIITKEKFKFV